MYEKLLDEARENGITVIEKYPFVSERIRGLYCDNTIALSAQIDTTAERTVVLCEELSHATHSFGNILQDARAARRTREKSFDRLIGKKGLVRAYLAGCREPWEYADFFGVPQSFIAEAMQNYRERYGTMTALSMKGGDFILSFEPTFRVHRIKSAKKKT